MIMTFYLCAAFNIKFIHFLGVIGGLTTDVMLKLLNRQMYTDEYVDLNFLLHIFNIGPFHKNM